MNTPTILVLGALSGCLDYTVSTLSEQGLSEGGDTDLWASPDTDEDGIPDRGPPSTEVFEPSHSETAPDPVGGVAVMLFTLFAADMDEDMTTGLVRNTIRAVYPFDAQANILLVLDDSHEGDDEDTRIFREYMETVGHTVELMTEPAGGLSVDDLAGYQVVALSNLIQPIDDAETVKAMLAFSRAGFGVILHGEDIALDETSAPLEALTRLRVTEEWNDEGDDNDEQLHIMQMNPDSAFSEGLPSERFYYEGAIYNAELIDPQGDIVMAAIDEGGRNRPGMIIWR